MSATISLGTWTPILAYAISCCGSALGLLCAERARSVAGPARRGWLVIAAVSIGGTGIWVMHFTAMMGMRMEGTAAEYNLPTTLVSMVVAVVVVGIGLFVANSDQNRLRRLLLGGAFTGVGVVGMHYVGMAAMSVHGTVHYDRALVALSVLIAVVAATAALWATTRVAGGRAIFAAALVMGVAVTGMHYTAIAAMRVQLDPNMQMTGDAQSSVLIPLIIIAVVVVSVLTVCVLVLAPSARELREDADLQEWAAGLPGELPR